MLNKLADKVNQASGVHVLEKCLILEGYTLAVGVYVMLTVNVDVSDGLVNGVYGIIAHVVLNRTINDILTLLAIDNPIVGVNAIQHTIYHQMYPPKIIECHIFAKGKRALEITHLQYF